MYLILAADDPDQLMDMVSAHMEKGWHLVGGLTAKGQMWAQAMTKEAE